MQSQQNMSKMNELKMKGGGRPSKKKVPKLRIIEAENENISLLSNLMRSFAPYWHLYDDHIQCKYGEEKSCNFCSVRSLSMRLNEQKREPFIYPYEILSNGLEEHTHSFESTIDFALTKMKENCDLFKSNSNLSVYCPACNIEKQIIGNPILNCQNKSEIEELKSCILRAIDERLASSSLCCKSIVENFQIANSQTFLFLKIDKPLTNIKIEEIQIVNKEFEVLACIASAEKETDAPNSCIQLEKEAYFQQHGIFLKQKNRDISQGEPKNVSFVVLGRKDYHGVSGIKPYGKDILYDKSKAGQKRKAKYEASEAGKKRKAKYESGKGKDTRKLHVYIY